MESHKVLLFRAAADILVHGNAFQINFWWSLTDKKPMSSLFLLAFTFFTLSACNQFSMDYNIQPPEAPGGTPLPPVNVPLKTSWVRQFGYVSAPKTNENIAKTNYQDNCNDTVVDGLGNIYCAGHTRGALGEVESWNGDAVIIKMSPTGTVLWTTQLGAYTKKVGGSHQNSDWCNSIALDGQGNIICAGYTSSSMSEVVGGFSDAFVLKLDPAGKLLWITQLGALTGSIFGNSLGQEQCTGVDTDGQGNIYCGGTTTGSFGEPNGGGLDAFILKLNPNGVLQWVTQLGATTKHPSGTNGGYDSCEDLKVTPDGYAHCGGSTYSSMAETASSQDIFVFQLDPLGGLVWLTQLGQSTRSPSGNNTGSEDCRSLVLDSANGVYCGGSTTGPMDEAGAGQDSVVIKLNANGVLQWVTQLGSVTKPSANSTNNSEICTDIDIDSNNFLYCAVETTSSFGETLAGTKDFALFQLNSSGQLTWAAQMGTTTKDPVGNNLGVDVCNGVSVDGSGSVYCAGTTTGSMQDTQGGSGDIFFAKFSTAGAFQWVKQLGTSYQYVSLRPVSYEYEKCSDLAVDSQGNSFCVVEFSNKSVGELKGGSSDIVILKYSSNGDLVWIKQLGAITKSATGNNTGGDYCNSITTDSEDNVICAGSTYGSMSAPNAGSNDVIVVKLSSAGELLWVTQHGLSGADRCDAVEVDKFNNIYCGGTTYSNLGETNGGQQDVFVMKVSPSGAVQWITQLGATTKPAGANHSGFEQLYEIAVDPDGNVYGGGGTYGRFAETNAGGQDIYYFKLAPNGQFLWGKQFGTTTTAPGGSNAGSERILGLAVDSEKNVLFSAMTDGSFAEAFGGQRDVVVGKFDPAGNLIWVKQFGSLTKVNAGGSNTGWDIAADLVAGSDNGFYVAGYTNGSFAESKAISYDAFVLKFSTTGSLLWGTQLGSVTKASGFNNDGDNSCYAIGIDKLGSVYCGGGDDGDGGEPSGGSADLSVFKLSPAGKLEN